MKLAIFGATGNTGIELIKQALEKGHTITAFVRDPARLPIKDENLTPIIGDVFDPTTVSQAVEGQDAIIIALGAGQELKKTTVRATGTTHIIQAMQSHQVKRLIVVTAMGTGDSWNDLSRLSKVLYITLLKSARADHEAQESAVKKSDLDWTIIRPSGLKDTPRTGLYQVGEHIKSNTSTIARADVADLILNELQQNNLIRKAVTITN